MFENYYLKKDIPVPLYYQLKEILLNIIHINPDGTLLPTEQEICDHFSVSRSTVRQTLKDLEVEGYIKREKGKGTKIVKKKNEIEKIYKQTSKEKIYAPISFTINNKLNLKNVEIGVSLFTHGAEFYSILRNVVKTKLEEFGITVLIADADDDVEIQYSQIDNFIAKNVCLIVIDPGSPPSRINSVIEKAYNLNIPIIVIDSQLDPKMNFLTYIGCDNYELGVRIGIHIGSYLKNKYKELKGKIAIIKGDPENIVGEEREKGMLDGIKKIQQKNSVEVVTRRYGFWLKDKGREATELILKENPYLDVIFTYNDNMAVGGLEAAEKANRREMIFTSFDGSKRALRNILEGGLIKAIGLNDPVRIGQLTTHIIISFLNNGNVPSKTILTEPIIITKENVKAYYNGKSNF